MTALMLVNKGDKHHPLQLPSCIHKDNSKTIISYFEKLKFHPIYVTIII